jgi:hypothetical protein
MIGIAALFLALIWMLRDEKDRARPVLVFALVLNLFYGYLLTVFMGKEGSLLPWKYDIILLHLDASLGASAPTIARALQGSLRIPLMIVYQSMVPMMILWVVVASETRDRGPLIFAYAAEMVTGPPLYAIVPACGPIYAFGAKWLDPPMVHTQMIHVAAAPNAFPSLHVATACTLALFAKDRVWRTTSIVFLLVTVLATLSTGEHYVLDLIPGLAFGCFATNVGYRRIRTSVIYFLVVLSWSLAVRFEYRILIDHALLLCTGAAVTGLLVTFGFCREWQMSRTQRSVSRILAHTQGRDTEWFTSVK